MNLSKINKEDIISFKFKFSHAVENLNYEMYTKGKDIKLIVFYGDDNEHFYDIPRFWVIKNELTKFDGNIGNKEDLKTVLRLLNIQ